MKNILLSATIILGISTAFAIDSNGWATTYESLSAFESAEGRSGYVKPIIDNLGNVLNSNWYVGANVARSFALEFGIPISLILIGDDDRNYSETGVTGNSYETPTIMGGHYNTDEPWNGTIPGNKALSALGVFTYPYLQTAASFYHTRIVFRGMWLPSISDMTKFDLIGFGLQYSFGHFFQYRLPPAAQPLDVSLVFGYNSSSIGYKPEDYEGSLDLDISTTNFSLVIGYKPVFFFEVMMSLGYQSAKMVSSGNLVCVATRYGEPTEDYGKKITPDITVKGNNGFRFGLSVAFQLGTAYHPVIGFDYAGKSSFTTNVLYLRQQFGVDKTPEEIAKEAAQDAWSDNSEDEWSTNTESEPLNDVSNEQYTSSPAPEAASEPAPTPVTGPAAQEPVEEAPSTTAVEEPVTETPASEPETSFPESSDEDGFEE